VDVVPRLTVLAGFELGTGMSVNIVAPERAAVELREAG
jgi:UDPglucose--hexose-1-phosphate uridylyltransferase